MKAAGVLDQALEAGIPRADHPVTIRVVPPSRFPSVDFGDMWHHRDLLRFLIWRDVKVRYQQTVLGAGWAILVPFMTMVVFSIFFGRLAHVPSNGLPYPVFSFAGLLPWTYFAVATSTATSSIAGNRHMITKVYFPRLLLPLAAVLTPLVDFFVAFFVLIGIMLLFHVIPTWTIMLAPLFVLLAVLTALSVGLWLSAANAIFRDVQFVIPFMIQLWLFASPVAYASTLVPGRWRWLYGLNPMTGVIDGFRWSLMGAGQPPGPQVLLSALVVLLLLVGGLAFFQRAEGVVADLV